jgi:hypothetical protein
MRETSLVSVRDFVPPHSLGDCVPAADRQMGEERGGDTAAPGREARAVGLPCTAPVAPGGSLRPRPLALDGSSSSSSGGEVLAANSLVSRPAPRAGQRRRSRRGHSRRPKPRRIQRPGHDPSPTRGSDPRTRTPGRYPCPHSLSPEPRLPPPARANVHPAALHRRAATPSPAHRAPTPTHGAPTSATSTANRAGTA